MIATYIFRFYLRGFQKVYFNKTLFPPIAVIFTIRRWGRLYFFHHVFLHSFPPPIYKVLYYKFEICPNTHAVFLALFGAEFRLLMTVFLTQIFKKFLAFYDTPRFIHSFYATRIKSTVSHPFTIVWVLPLSTEIVGLNPSRAMAVGVPSCTVRLLFRTCKGLHVRYRNPNEFSLI